MPGLNVTDVVNVSVSISPVAAATRNFGQLLIFGSSNVIDTTERLRFYSSADDIGADFGSTAPEYLAALVYFGQSPQPAGCYVGRWAQAATSAVLHCGVLTPAQQAIGNFTAVTSGGFKITVDGVLKSLAAINLSIAVNLNGVAAAITTALAGSATCTYDARLARFNVTSATTGTASTITVMSAPASGTDLSPLLAGAATAASAPVQGVAAEPVTDAFNALADKSNDWYGLQTATAMLSDPQKLTLAAAVEAAPVSRIFGHTITSTTVLDPTSTTDLASMLMALGYKRTFVQYSSSNPYASAGIFGVAFTVAFTGADTTITVKFKQEAGVVAETLTESQARTLRAKNCNVYVAYNNATSIVQEGVMAGGQFFDETHGLDWLQNFVQTGIYNRLYTGRKVPQTDPGVHSLVTEAESSCLQAKRNGLFAPGVWNGPTFGPVNTGDTLEKGFFVFAAPVASQAQADRDARKAPLIQIAGKLAGAVHFANVLISVNR